MGYASVQIFGRTAAIKAFRNTQCMNWSLLQGRQLLFKYEGGDLNEGGNQLDELLKMIAESSGSDAVYTLRWYERDEPPEKKPKPGAKQVARVLPKMKIYESTPFDGSFNFKLFGDESSGHSNSARYNEVQAMKQEMAEIKTMFQEFVKKANQDDADDEGKASGIAGFLNGMLEVPEIKAAIAGKVVQLFNGVTGKIGSMLDPSHQLPAKIAGPEPAVQPIQMSQADVDKLNSALTILAKADPDLPDHLTKLSSIARDNPAMYNSLIGMLNKM